MENLKTWLFWSESPASLTGSPFSAFAPVIHFPQGSQDNFEKNLWLSSSLKLPRTSHYTWSQIQSLLGPGWLFLIWPYFSGSSILYSPQCPNPAGCLLFLEQARFIFLCTCYSLLLEQNLLIRSLLKVITSERPFPEHSIKTSLLHPHSASNHSAYLLYSTYHYLKYRIDLFCLRIPFFFFTPSIGSKLPKRNVTLFSYNPNL